MQKKLLGMAVAAALAAPGLVLAQSAVQVYGTVHMSLSNTKFSSDTTGFPGQTKFGVNSHSSNWGLRSTETLGGGMTAWFQAEFQMLMERVNGVSNGAGQSRNSGVGLRGGFGNIYVGTWESPWAQTFRLWDVGTIGGWGPVTSIIGRRETTTSGRAWNCNNAVGVSGGAGNAGSATGAPSFPNGPVCGNVQDGVTPAAGYALWRRMGASVFYESPLFEGVQLKFAWQPNETKSDVVNQVAVPTNNQTVNGFSNTAGVNSNPSMWSGSLTWTGLGGRARAFIANMQAKDWSSIGQTDSGYTAGGGYDFGVANVGATFERYTYKMPAGEMKAQEWGAGLSVPMGPGRIGASYAKAKKLTGDGAPASPNDDTAAKMWNLGYEWALSKRTVLGFGYAKIDNGANVGFTWSSMTNNQTGYVTGPAAANPGSDQTNLFVSMRHSF